MKDNTYEASSQHRPQDKLTEWKKEPDVMALKEDLQVASTSHDIRVAKVDAWLDLRNITGKAKPSVIKNRSSVQPKLVRRQNEWRYSALSEPFLSADKLYDVDPMTFEDEAGSKQNETLLEWQFRTKIDRVKFIDEYVRTAVDEGTVYVRTGWKRETVMEKVEVPVYEFVQPPMHEAQEYAEQMEQVLAIKAEDPRGFSELPPETQEAAKYTEEKGTPVIARVVGKELVEQEKIIENCPTANIIHYKNIYIDPSAEGDINNAGFAILSFETSKAKCIKDGRYKNLDQVNWSSNTTQSQPDHVSTNDDAIQFKDELRKNVVAYEYWGWYNIHGDNKLVPIVATWIGNTMIRMEENPYPDRKIPITVANYMPVKRSIEGEPDAELLGDNQAILGATTRGMVDLLGRSANGQIATAKGMLDTVNRRKKDAGVDYEFNPNMHPTQSIHTHEYPAIPNSAMNMLNLQNQEAEALTGVKAFSGGLSGEAFGEVAAGIRGMLDASSKREMGILRRLAAGIVDIGKKFISMNQVFMSEEEVIRVTNKQYVTIRREDLAGNFDLKVDITTAEIDEAKAQDLSFMLQTIGNTMDPSMTNMILAEIASLKRMPTLAEKIIRFKPEPDPMVVELQKMEVEKARKEIEEIDSKINLNNAKAEKERAEADIQNLNFVEQETGTTHARDVDRVEAQAESNERLEVTKAMLNPQSPPQ